MRPPFSGVRLPWAAIQLVVIGLVGWALSACATGGAEVRTLSGSTDDCSMVGASNLAGHHAWPGALLASGCDLGAQAGNVRLEITPRVALLALSADAWRQASSDGTTLGSPAQRLVEGWPSLDREPFLGHNVLGITVLDSVRVEVVFRDSLPVAEIVADRVRLFADPRLGFTRTANPGDPFQAMVSDGRAMVDRGEVLPTVHQATLEYAFAAGRVIDPMAWGVAYLLAAPPTTTASSEDPSTVRETAGVPDGDDVASWVAQDWGGPDRIDRSSWPSLYLRPRDRPEMGHCPGLGIGSVPRATGSRNGASVIGRPEGREAISTIHYRKGDAVGREIAERIVSASLRSGPEGALIESWLGARSSEGLRAVSLGGAEWDSALRAGDGAAFVVPLPWGPMSYCSVLGEVGRRMPWAVLSADSGRFFGSPYVSPVGVVNGYVIRGTQGRERDAGSLNGKRP